MLLNCKVRKQFICQLKAFGAQGILEERETEKERELMRVYMCA